MTRTLRGAAFSAICLVASALAACHGGTALPVPAGNAASLDLRRFIVVPPAAHRHRRHHIRLGRTHYFKPRGKRGARIHPHAQGNMTYHGGPVQTAPAVRLIFWGFTNPPASDTTADPDGVVNDLFYFYNDLGCSSWINTLTQYSSITNPCVMLGQSYVDPSPPPTTYTQTDVANEVESIATLYGTANFDTNFVVVTPTGYAQNGFGSTFCAYHSYYSSGGKVQPYTLLGYTPDQNCGNGFVNTPGTLDGVTINAGHEQAETETDPEINAWYDTSETAPYCSGGDASVYCEIGDKCSWTDIENTPFGSDSFPTQPLWSNSDRACEQSYTATPTPVPTSTPTPTPTPVPTPTATPSPVPTPGAVRVFPHFLKFRKTAGSEKVISVGQLNYSGAFKITGCKRIVKISTTSDGIGHYRVIPTHTGKCSATFTGGARKTGTLNVIVKR